MTFSHEDANARLLDLVYGEAAPTEREALEAHVATCERCQQELAALGDTRARLRVALDDQPVPARAHARILAAAAAEASNGAAGAATAPPAKGNEPASRAARAADEPSFWERLRAKWTLPTFATVGAVAVMLLGAKVFFDPQKSLERGREVGSFSKAPEQQGEALAPTADPAAQPAPPAEPAAAANEGESDKLPQRDEGRLSPQARARIESVRQFGGPRHKVNDLLGNKPSFKSDKLGGAPASRALEGLRPDSFGAGRGAGSVGGATSAAPREFEKKSAKGGLDDLLEDTAPSASKRYARPPAEWKAGQPGGAAPATAAAPPPPPPKPAPVQLRKKTVEDSPLDGLGLSSGGASRPSSAPVARAPVAREEEADELQERLPAKRKSAPAPEPSAPAAAAAPMARSESAAKAEAPPADAKKEKDAAPSYQTLARRADELYTAGRWAEATAAYAELIRRFPTAEPAPRWRARLVTAQREAAPPPAATRPAAKAGKAAAAPASE